MTPHAPPERPVGRAFDTSKHAAAVQLAAWRRMNGAERLAVALALSTATQELALAGLRARHPEERQEALVRRLLAGR